jgi:hypothetical protein
MIMKKSKAIFIAVILLILTLSLNMLNSQDENAVPYGIDQAQLENTTTKLTTTWDYLSKEWKTMLLENPVVKGIDSFFQKISIVFLVLFGMSYSFSLVLLFIVILWFFFFIMFNRVFWGFSTFSKWVCRGISALLVVAMAHMTLLEKQANFFITLIFGQKNWWMKTIYGVGVLLIIVFLIALVSKVGNDFKKKKEKEKEEEDKRKVHLGGIAGEALKKAMENDR